MGSIGLLYATQTRAPHCSHSQLNNGVDGIGTSSTRGQASTSRNPKSGMYERYTRNLFGPCAKSGSVKIPIALTRIPQSRVSFSSCGGVTPSALGHNGQTTAAKVDRCPLLSNSGQNGASRRMKRTLGNAKQNADGNAKQNIAVIISSGWHYNRSKFYKTFTRYALGPAFSLKYRHLGKR